MDPRNPEQAGNQVTSTITHLPAGIQIMPQSLITSGIQRDCIRLRNLPCATQVTDILSFLGEFSQFIVYQGVHMVYTAAGDPSGEAFIQLDSEEAAAMTAVSRHKRPMAFANKKRVIDVIQCSGDDMSFVLTSGMPHLPLPLPAALPSPQIPPPSQITLQGQLLTPVTPQSVMSSTSLTSSGTFPYLSLTPPLTTTFTPTSMLLSQPPAYYPPIIYWYQTPPLTQTPAISYYGTAANVGAELYAGPYMVMMKGLPLDVTVEDIVSYFKDFPEVGPESVSIQVSLEGKPTGDALIFFSSRPEAERAVIEGSRRQIGNRLVELFIA